MSETVDKLVIADQMIEASIEEFLDSQRYFSAFNLAGVAEELYGKYVRVTGGRDAQQEGIGQRQKSQNYMVRQSKLFATGRK